MLALAPQAVLLYPPCPNLPSLALTRRAACAGPQPVQVRRARLQQVLPQGVAAAVAHQILPHRRGHAVSRQRRRCQLGAGARLCIVCGGRRHCSRWLANARRHAARPCPAAAAQHAQAQGLPHAMLCTVVHSQARRTATHCIPSEPSSCLLWSRSPVRQRPTRAPHPRAARSARHRPGRGGGQSQLPPHSCPCSSLAPIPQRQRSRARVRPDHVFCLHAFAVFDPPPPSHSTVIAVSQQHQRRGCCGRLGGHGPERRRTAGRDVDAVRVRLRGGVESHDPVRALLPLAARVCLCLSTSWL